MEPQQVNQDAAAPTDPSEYGSWAKIVIVEDDEALSEIYKTRLELMGYICFVAHEGIEALQIIEKERPSLVLLDLMMPKIAGAQVLQIMRSNEWGKDIKVLVITNLNESDAPAGLRSYGIEGYVVKANLSNDQIDQLVTAALKSSNTETTATTDAAA